MHNCVKYNCVLLSIVATILTSVNEVSSISCYECTSLNDTACGDPFNPGEKIIPVDCNTKPAMRDISGNVTAKLCRKSLQTVFGKTRIIRGCGYIADKKRDDKPCKEIDQATYLYILFCSCTKDLCNDGNTIDYITYKTVIILVVLFKQYPRVE